MERWYRWWWKVVWCGADGGVCGSGADGGEGGGCGVSVVSSYKFS